MRYMTRLGAFGICLLALGAARAETLKATAKPDLKLQMTKVPTVDWVSVSQKAMTAASYGIDAWANAARMNVVVESLRATVTSTNGALQSSVDVETAVRGAFDSSVPSDIVQAFARAIGKSWNSWSSNYHLSAIPWYSSDKFSPHFTFNVPNIPTPVRSGISSRELDLSRPLLARAIKAELGARANEAGAADAIDDFARRFDSAFGAWQLDTLETKCLSPGKLAVTPSPTGPIPIPFPNTSNFGPPTAMCPAGFLTGPGFQSNVKAYDKYDAFVGHAKIHLQAGVVDEGPNQVTFRGKFEISSTGFAAAKITVRDAVLSLFHSQQLVKVSSRERIAVARVGSSASVSADAHASASVPTFDGATGGGTVELQVGKFTLTTAHADFKLEPQSDGSLKVTIGRRGDICDTTMVVKFSAGTMQIHDDGQCVGLVESRDIKVEPLTLKGTSVMKFFGRTITTDLVSTGSLLKATATYSPAARGWQRLPGLNTVEARVVNPRVTFELSESLTGLSNPSVESKTREVITLAVDKLEVRTTQNGPDGNPWAQASIGPISAPISPLGELTLGLPPALVAIIRDPTVQDTLCDISCGVLSPLHLAAPVNSGFGFELHHIGASIKYTGDSHEKCEIDAPRAWVWDRCNSNTVCPGGTRFTDGNGVYKCRIPINIPQLPRLPSSISASLSDWAN